MRHHLHPASPCLFAQTPDNVQARLDGTVATADRADIIQHFRHDDVPVMLLSVRAGGVGLNLVWDQSWADHTIYGFAGAIVLAVVLLGLYEGGVGRRPTR